MIPILIRGDLNGYWNRNPEQFLLDTGADSTILHSDEATRVGLDTNKCDDVGSIQGIDGVRRPIYYKKGILIRIGNFPPIPLTVGFSPYVRKGLRLLGRRTILNLLGIAFNGNEVGIFTKRSI